MNSSTLYATLWLLSQIRNACSHITQFRETDKRRRGTSVDEFDVHHKSYSLNI